MNCDWVKDRVELFVFGELEFHDEELLESHAASCPSCQALIEEHRTILRLMNEAELEPPPALLQECRQGLRQQLTIARQQESTFWVRAAKYLPAWPMVWKPALGCVMLALSFYAGGWAEQRKTMDSLGGEVARIRTIHGTGNGTVQIVLDEPRQRMIEGNLHEAGIERALLAAAIHSPDASMRVESVDLLRNRTNRDDVRQVMLRTLETDESAIVRLRALEALRPHAHVEQVRQSMSRVLLKDTDPRVRVQAIDLLVDRTEGNLVGTLQEVIRHEQDEYIRARCLRVLSQLRASPGVF